MCQLDLNDNFVAITHLGPRVIGTLLSDKSIMTIFFCRRIHTKKEIMTQD